MRPPALQELRTALNEIYGPLGPVPSFEKRMVTALADEGSRRRLRREQDKNVADALIADLVDRADFRESASVGSALASQSGYQWSRVAGREPNPRTMAPRPSRRRGSAGRDPVHRGRSGFATMDRLVEGAPNA